MPTRSRSAWCCRWPILPRPMTARRPIRKYSRLSSRSCRKSCRSAPRKRARNSKAVSLAHRLRRFQASPNKSQAGDRRRCLVARGGGARAVTALAILDELLGDLRMTHRFAAGVRQKVLFGNVSDVLGIVVLSEQMIKRLVLVRPHFHGDRLVPLIGIVEYRIDVEHHPAKRIEAVADDLADLEFGDPNPVHAV